jgi:3-hydroxyisobutyrate dehydrogenase
MKTIAVIGTGIMGSGIAANFLKNGYPVFVYNRSAEKLQPLIQQGAKSASSPRQAAESSDIVFEVTASDESSRSVWLGEEGILAGASKNSVLVASGTFSAAWVDELAKISEAKGFVFFDIPLTGGRTGAESGELVLLAGGDKSKLEELMPDLKAISKEVIYFGKSGSGARYKLLLNQLQAIHLAAFSEVMKIAEKAGLNREAVGRALASLPGGTATNLAFRYYKNVPKDPNFAVKWIKKDLDYAQQLGEGTDTLFLEAALNKFQEAESKGLSDSDWTSVSEL